MSEKEKKTIEEISKAVSGMTEAEKARFLGIAEGMSIMKDMDMIYDLKMLRPDKKTRLKSLYEKYIGRMDEAQRAAWDKFYTPIIDDFYKQNL